MKYKVSVVLLTFNLKWELANTVVEGQWCCNIHGEWAFLKDIGRFIFLVVFNSFSGHYGI